ncbi:Ankyrin repeat-containing protein itn1, variant 2 [Ancistrocladus abbreviatus]
MGAETAVEVAPQPSPTSAMMPSAIFTKKKLAFTNPGKKLTFYKSGRSSSTTNLAKLGCEKDLEMGGDQGIELSEPPSPVTPMTPMTPTVIMYNAGKAFAVSNSAKQLASSNSGKSLGLSNPGKALLVSNSGKSLAVSNPAKMLLSSNSEKSLGASNSGKSLGLSNSGKRMDQKKMYVKQVTGKHNDTEMHLAAQRGDVRAVKQILAEIEAQMTGTDGGAEFDAELVEIRMAIVNDENELGETALFTAAEKGHLGVVKELLPYMTSEGIASKNRSGFDALHIAARQGHQAIVQVLLDHYPELSKTVGQSNTTPLISAATRGHVDVVKELLAKDSSLPEISKTNGKNALHMAARQGHSDVVRALLEKDPQLARRMDKKGQTALHMAVKGQSCKVVRWLLEADPAIVMLPDRFGNQALHIATRKKRAEIVSELLLLPHINVNALNRDHKTPLDIAEGLPLSQETSEIKDVLMRYGALKAKELNQPRDELRKTVSEIQRNVHSQLEQARKTNKNVSGIAKELKKLHREGINNATNSVTVVASLFATVAFAAIFTVPGGDDDTGTAVMASSTSFRVFLIFDAIALFTSLAVVVVQITVVRGETKSERRVVEIINKLMWLAAVCTTVAFLSSSYIVVGRHNKWAAIFITVVGAVVMASVLGTMTFYVVKYRRIRKVRKKEKSSRGGTRSFYETDLSESEFNPIYAI